MFFERESTVHAVMRHEHPEVRRLRHPDRADKRLGVIGVAPCL